MPSVNHVAFIPLHYDYAFFMKATLFRTIPALFCLLLLEGLCQINYRLRSDDHKWLFQHSRVEATLYQSHPFLAKVGRPNVRGKVADNWYSHNALGYPGPAPRAFSARQAAQNSPPC